MKIKKLFSPIRSTPVQFGLFGPFYLLWFNLVLFSPCCTLWSTLVLLRSFGPLLSILSTFFYSVNSVHFGPIQFKIFLFGPLRSYSNQFGFVRSILSISVLFGPFVLIRSTMFLFGPILSIWSTLFYLVQFSPFESLRFILVHLDLFLCTYIMGMDI